MINTTPHCSFLWDFSGWMKRRRDKWGKKSGPQAVVGSQMSLGCNPQGSKAVQRDPNTSSTLLSSCLLFSALLSTIVLTSPSYLIGHPLTPICNSNENQTPALPTFTPFCRLLPRQQGEKDRHKKAVERKVSEVKRIGESVYQQRDIMLLLA